MMRKKLSSQKGETLTEALCAVLIVGLSAALFYGMVTTAGNLNTKATAQDDGLYSAISAVETGAGEPAAKLNGKDSSNGSTITVTLTEHATGTIPVYVRNGLAAYHAKGATP